MDDESDDKDDTKSFLCRKSRNLSEKKRRDQFNSLVNDLSALISTSSRKMDKSTVLKSTIAFLKNHNEATDRSKVFEIQQDWKPTFLSNDEYTHLMLESLDGFMMVFSSMGSIFYASESITSQLGYLPQDLYNMTIYDLAYEMDHEALLNIFMNPTPVIEPRQTDISSSNQITFYTHLRRGGMEKVDANAYELVKFVGYFRNDTNTSTGSSSEASNGSNGQPAVLPRIFQQNPSAEVDKKLVFVGTGRVQNPQLIREMSIIDPTSNEFTSKHSMEWKFLFLDHRAPPIIGYMPFEVLGTSGYDYYHFDDLDSIVACHEELRQTGEGKSCYYRFLTKGQQWIWLQTDYYVSYHQFNSKPDYVVCTHKVVSYAEVLKESRKSEGEKSGNSSSNNNNGSSKVIASTANSSKSASATTTLRDFELSSQNLDTTLLGNSLANLGNETTATSPAVDSSPMWSATAAQPSGSCQINPLKTSRPASSYGNISSTGISPKAKRKCYFYNNRGNDSDSTSISADSVTSRQSMMTHVSTPTTAIASPRPPSRASPQSVTSSPAAAAATAASEPATPEPAAATAAAAAASAAATATAAYSGHSEAGAPAADSTHADNDRKRVPVPAARLPADQLPTGGAHLPGATAVPHRHSHATCDRPLSGGARPVAHPGAGSAGSAARHRGDDAHAESAAGPAAAEARRAAEADPAAAERAEDRLGAAAALPLHVPAAHDVDGLCAREHDFRGSGKYGGRWSAGTELHRQQCRPAAVQSVWIRLELGADAEPAGSADDDAAAAEPALAAPTQLAAAASESHATAAAQSATAAAAATAAATTTAATTAAATATAASAATTAATAAATVAAAAAK
ncbi:circadian locomoter output cycles protein kaput isoform X4 [Drosophila biarmipes]|uniref:circadian locomoter output cycles protein kaput isoform X4 n=1 Tax=Drosophila biarmipes TaxID=125945 RepID=UPI0007E5DA2F|nr:circadian locomoter output cycles protein kaput isoform X4 [Drosophila biarmipes]